MKTKRVSSFKEHLYVEQWYSADKIINYLGVTRDTIYFWLVDKQILVNKAGKLWKFDKADENKWGRPEKATEVQIS